MKIRQLVLAALAACTLYGAAGPALAQSWGEPVYDQGQRSRRISVNDELRSTDVYSLAGNVVVVRNSYRHENGYSATDYYVDHTGYLYYNTTWNVWMVDVNGRSFAIAWATTTSATPRSRFCGRPRARCAPNTTSTTVTGCPMRSSPAPLPRHDTTTTAPFPVAAFPAGLRLHSWSLRRLYPGRAC